MCATAHSAKPHIIGWRVIANTPRGAGTVLGVPAGSGIAGLPRNDPISRIDANSVSRLATAHSASPTGHSIGASGTAR